MKYIKDYILKNDGFVKVLSDPIIENTDKGLVICQLDFNYSSKETQELLQLLYGIITEFKSQYGSNQDKFSYDLEKNILIKEYTVIAGKNKVSKHYIKTFPLTEELKKELIDYIIIKGKEYSNMNLEENIESPITTITEEKPKSILTFKKELKDFSEFNNVMEIDTYLRTNVNATAFIKWLQDKKIITLNHTYAPQELVKKPVEELNKLRQKYLTEESLL
jgi:hypothetical protein